MSSEIIIPGPQYGLNQIIDAFTSELVEKRAKEDKYNPLRPSSAGKCTKELGYSLMEYRGFANYGKEPLPPDVHRLLNFGHSVERHMLDEMYNAFKLSPKPIKIKYKQQVVTLGRLPNGDILEGSLDFVVEADEWKILADAKSKGDKYSQFYKSSWDEFVGKLCSTGYAVQFGEDAVFITDLEKFLGEFDDFFTDNLYQLNGYACTDFCRERGINLCAIMQYNKNDSRLREIRFVPNQAIADKVKAKFDLVQKTVDTEKSVENLPQDYVLGSRKCGFCDRRHLCWPEDNAMKVYFKTLPPKKWPKDLDRLDKSVQMELGDLFEEYRALEDKPARLKKVEEKIISTLNRIKVFKLRLSKDQVYSVKHLKSGGPAGGPRWVLRRDKE